MFWFFLRFMCELTYSIWSERILLGLKQMYVSVFLKPGCTVCWLTWTESNMLLSVYSQRSWSHRRRHHPVVSRRGTQASLCTPTVTHSGGGHRHDFRGCWACTSLWCIYDKTNQIPTPTPTPSGDRSCQRQGYALHTTCSWLPATLTRCSAVVVPPKTGFVLLDINWYRLFN